jgi:hypothetical protein
VQVVEGAVTVPLSAAQKRASVLWAQGGTPGDPVLAGTHGTIGDPEYGFGTLRCGNDYYNGDNVERVSFPANGRHVFC